MAGRSAALAVLLLTVPACQASETGGDANAAQSAPAAGKPADAVAGVADPVRFVKAAYGFDQQSPDKPSAPEMLDEDRPEYSPRLRALFAIQQREHGEGEVGRMDMDIFTGAQDGEVSGLAVESRDVDFASPPRRIVTARFKLQGEPRVMTFYFEQAGGRWLLDDIAFPGDGKVNGIPPWTLSLVLKYGW